MGPRGSCATHSGLSASNGYRQPPLLLCRKKECPLCAQLPIRAGGLRCHHIIVGTDLSIDRLITDLEDAPDATAHRHSPAVVVISLPISRHEGGRRQIPAVG